MKSFITLGVLLFIFFQCFSQDSLTIDRQRWIDDTPNSNYSSYRGFISGNPNFFIIVKGKTKKQLKTLLGKPNAINRSGFKGIKGTIGFVYCIDKSTINIPCIKKRNKCDPCKSASITIVIKNGIVDDIIGIHSGG